MTTTELLLDAPDPRSPQRARYRLTLAGDATEVAAAQHLRHRIFSEEFGASTPGPELLDADEFDDHCDHLIVWHEQTDPDRGALHTTGREAVATYRLLPAHSNDADPRSAGLYSGGEFDLTPLEPLLPSAVEAGRSCVAAEHRSGTAVSLLWGGIARYMHLAGYRYLLGCASISLADGGGNAAAFADLAAAKHLPASELRCAPHRPLPLDGLPRPARAVIPPLLRGYLRLGAVVCGAPAHDPEFGTADFLVLLDLDNTDRRYLRFFLGGSS